jgi:hypothetical protein
MSNLQPHNHGSIGMLAAAMAMATSLALMMRWLAG